jgi:hypothetical protein
VRRLAAVAGLAPHEERSFDWRAIEEALGLRLPADYKVLAESFPLGWFRMFAKVEVPAGRQRLLGDYAVMQLDHLRQVRATGESSFPFPVFPEPGGVLPWGSIGSPGLAFWLTEADDPDGWPVIAAGSHDYWDRFDGPACEFLAEVAAGRYDASGFPDLDRESGGGTGFTALTWQRGRCSRRCRRARPRRPCRHPGNWRGSGRGSGRPREACCRACSNGGRRTRWLSCAA